MTEDEIGTFENKYGYKPTFYKVALDALAIYVNKSIRFAHDVTAGRRSILQHPQEGRLIVATWDLLVFREIGQ